MTGYNLIVVFDPTGKKVLLCKRIKEPYLGLYNFIGGHIENGETGSDAAYRELFEETSIDRTSDFPLAPHGLHILQSGLLCRRCGPGN